MKLTGKTLSSLAGVLFLCMFIGTLAWEIIARIAAAASIDIAFALGPYGFDLGILAFWIRLNPGTLLAVPCGVLIFRAI